MTDRNNERTTQQRGRRGQSLYGRKVPCPVWDETDNSEGIGSSMVSQEKECVDLVNEDFLNVP